MGSLGVVESQREDGEDPSCSSGVPCAVSCSWPVAVESLAAVFLPSDWGLLSVAGHACDSRQHERHANVIVCSYL